MTLLAVEPTLELGLRESLHIGDLRADGVVLIRGQCDRREDADDRDHDHQFDQGKALLHAFHLNTPLI